MLSKRTKLILGSAMVALFVLLTTSALAYPIIDPPPVTKYYGKSWSYDGWGYQGSLSSTYSNDGNYLTVYAVLWPFPPQGSPWWPWYHCWLKIYFNGVKARWIVFEYYMVPYGTYNELTIVHTDGYSKSWSGYYGQQVKASIDSTKPVDYVLLRMDQNGLPIGSFIQFDVVYLIK